MDKAQVLSEWIEATDDAIKALTDWRAQLADWSARGGEACAGDFDANFQNLFNAGLGDTWADAVQAGGGVDVLAAVVKGGTICPTCDGKGKVRWSGLGDTCPACGGTGALAAGDKAGDPATGPIADRLREALAFVVAQKRFAVHVWYKNARGLNETGRVLAWNGGPSLLALADLLTGERQTVNLADVFDVEVGA